MISVVGTTRDHIPLKYRCRNEIGSQIRHVYLITLHLLLPNTRSIMWSSMIIKERERVWLKHDNDPCVVCHVWWDREINW